MRDRLDMMKDKLGGKIEDLSFDRDSLTLKVQGINLTLRIIEREPMKCVKFEGDKTPVPLNLWIQILPVTEAEAKIKVTIRAEVNMFMKAMISKPLQEGVEDCGYVSYDTLLKIELWLRNFGKKAFR